MTLDGYDNTLIKSIEMSCQITTSTRMDEAIMPPPHVLVFPAPAQGHISSMLKLADLLCGAAGFHVTFLIPGYIHRRLSQHSHITCRPSFRLRSIPDGHKEDILPGSFDVKEWLDSVRATSQPFLRELLSKDEVSCVICDGILSFVSEVGEECGVPVLYMRTLSASAFWVYFCLPRLIHSRQLPFNSDDMELAIDEIGGMEGILRQRDLPSCCRSGLNSTSMQTIMHHTLQSPKAKGLIFNTFHHLEAPALHQIRTAIPNVYAIGPLHAHLKTRLHHSHSSTTLWEEDQSSLAWLNQQPPKSVIYVSFGSIVQVTRDAQIEFLNGLVNSGKRFLWVIRPDSSGIATQVLEDTKHRGLVVGWAPQEEVLAHPAVAAFLTHCGWNSTLESVVAGVPMICWPHFGDQQVNSRFVGEVWRLGCDMKDSCDRVTVEKMVRNVMEDKRDEFSQMSQDMAISAQKSVEEGGTSYADFDRLVQDIRSLARAT